MVVQQKQAEICRFSEENGLCEDFLIFSEKSACGFLRLTLEPPSPAALRRTTGRQTERRSEALDGQTVRKFEVDEAGGARKLVAQSVDFVSRVCGSGAI